LTLDPEFIPRLDISSDLVRLALAAVGNDVVVIFTRDRSDTVFERSRKEIIPRLVSVVLGLWVAVEHFVKLVRRSRRIVCDFLERLDAVWAEPSFSIGTKDLGRFG